ncbi:tRNA N6-adenosine threonylcarbamoyltransferase, mitochondrial isoform X1 [Lethenteron reissneri]|uniref:tRNA N6-adenosine threonylcarbamoyltransferase, mitochondrial isoform X1 n=1 Tax=Lethenteron reissneri TaxID=7753 RepID=UPI002AB5F400|nr:tRNA N6-adenosine threonylcarbamoyltransferase, mitochondrial isoform X1 [Lethenteron reissneri]
MTITTTTMSNFTRTLRGASLTVSGLSRLVAPRGCRSPSRAESGGASRRPQAVATGGAPSLVLGLETSCDETGAAVLCARSGALLGEALHSQKEVHVRNGGIIPTLAQQLHKEHIDGVVQEALRASGASLCHLHAIATSVRPGLALCLAVGLEHSALLLECAGPHVKFIPIHHMEAHALTVRMMQQVEFPFLVLLVSGGHCLLAVARGVNDFLRLGQTLDEAPGDIFDKVARRLSLHNISELSAMSGGQAVEHISKDGNRMAFHFKQPLEKYRDCNFSFSGLRTQVSQTIKQKELEEGIKEGQVLECASSIAAATQYTVAAHIAKRTHRAMVFCLQNSLIPTDNPTLVVSGGVASNSVIKEALGHVATAVGFSVICPPPHLCTDNGIMIGWNGVERLRANVGILPNANGIRFEPRSPLGVDISEQVSNASIRVPLVNLKI